MNQAQRKYLIEKITKKIGTKVSELEKSKLEYPSLSNWLWKSAMDGTLEIKNTEQIKEFFKQRAKAIKEGENWLSAERRGWHVDKTTIKMPAKDLFVLPKSYYDEEKRVDEHNKGVHRAIEELRGKSEMLITRIQLASAKTLEQMINEVDDMGDISLVDMTIKAIAAGTTIEQLKLKK